ncbi:hypothetical protein DH2020_035399 [Rehmannia glutinosa]|uniref:RNase H type-1 domain-containing protein n=1 Tax=Rehmannia glutinosa TaxID=99300 RepID=A0ABR0V6K1_REHGL
MSWRSSESKGCQLVLLDCKESSSLLGVLSPFRACVRASSYPFRRHRPLSPSDQLRSSSSPRPLSAHSGQISHTQKKRKKKESRLSGCSANSCVDNEVTSVSLSFETTEGIETSSHIFLKCREVQTIWYTSPLRMDLSITSFESPKNLIWCAMIKYPIEYVEYLACLAWRIWNEQNDVYMKEGVFNVERVIRMANKIQGETLSPSPKGTRNGPNHSVPHSWTVPEQGQLKMNCDAAVYKDGSLGYGFVVRDSVGDVLLSGTKRTNMEGSSTLAEDLTLIFRLTACRDTGLRQVLIECDCKILIDGLAGKIVPEFYGDLLIKDIMETGEEIGCCSFKHIPREANKLAHALAHLICTRS